MKWHLGSPRSLVVICSLNRKVLCVDCSHVWAFGYQISVLRKESAVGILSSTAAQTQKEAQNKRNREKCIEDKIRKIIRKLGNANRML